MKRSLATSIAVSGALVVASAAGATAAQASAAALPAAAVAATPVAGIASAPAPTTVEPKSDRLSPSRIKADAVVLTVTSPFQFGTAKHSQWYARNYMAVRYGWGADQFRALKRLYQHESNWRHRVANPSSGAYGIPQSLPGKKMASFGADWRTNPETQIKWGLDYIQKVYGTPTRAWGFWTGHNWY